MTQKELKKHIYYNKKTGEFYRRDSYGKKGKKIGYFTERGYIRIWIKGKQYFSHRLAWLYVYGFFPKNFIDHINGIKDDNRICNLCDVTNTENSQNRKAYNTGESGYTGVIPKKGKWKAQISVDNKTHHLGTFINKEDAYKERLRAEKKYYKYKQKILSRSLSDYSR